MEEVARATHVDLFVFSYRSMSTSAAMALEGLIRESQAAGITINKRTYGNALIHRSRNQVLGKLHPDATHVLFIDDDMLANPDALIRLLELDRPVVSALCTNRSNPTCIAAKAYNPETDQYGALAAVNLTRPVEGPFAVGAAFLLLRRDVIEHLIEHYLSADDWVADNQRLFVRLKVRAENRDKEKTRISTLRRAHYEHEKTLRVFGFPVSEAELEMGEDIGFSRRLHQIGVPIVIDGRTLVGHLGEYPYTVQDVIRQQNKEQVTP